jgi:hypothetical protein
MKERPDFLSEETPEGLEVFQLTTEEKVPASHIYMEAQVFTPDSKRLILHRSAHPHGSDPLDLEHRYLICDLEGGGELVPITEEAGATAPSVSPDGSRLYYFVNQTEVGGGRLILKKVELDGTGREELLGIDHPLPGTTFRPSRPYPLSTISADGKRLAISAFLGDGRMENAPWGLLVFDLEGGMVELILHGQSWCNVHPQYSGSTDPVEGRDLLIQENHDNLCDPQGKVGKLVGGKGADIHVIRDDGTRMRDLPWGRDGNEFCQGHQCWIGRSDRAITSTGTREPQSARLITGKPIDHVGHLGARTAGGWRNDLTRELPQPDFYHFATDIAGRKFITDAGPKDRGGALWLAELAEDEEAPLKKVTFLLNPGSSWQKDTHIHPFLSPDGKAGFFNSDESGLLQAYMVRGWAD